MYRICSEEYDQRPNWALKREISRLDAICVAMTKIRRRERMQRAMKKRKDTELEIVIQLRGEEIVGRMNEYLEKKIMKIYGEYPYAKIRIEVLG